MASDLCAFWFAVVVHLLAIASVTVARLSENSATQTGHQRLFFLCLIAVGLASVVSIYVGDASRLFCAVTLPIMAVGATLDLKTPGAQTHI